MFQTDHRREVPAFTNPHSACQACLQDLTFALSGPTARQHAKLYGRGKQWQKTARQLDDQFDNFLRTFALPFKSWAENNFGERHDPETVFYPFGGPDFCFPYYLFPNAREYILVGFEPCSLWPLDEVSSAFQLGGTLDAMRHYLSFSYFITKDLDRSLAGTDVRSVLPLLLTQIARCGLPLLSVEPNANGAEGLCIEFGEPHAPRCLYYFRQDLRDIQWNESNSLHRRLLVTNGLAVFVKSASYLLHEPPFERLRHVIRKHASILVQDPSGVPYDLLKKWRWSAGLHGQFTSDIPVFSRYDQSSLARAYLSKDSQRLEFGIGYLTTPSVSSLVVASPPEPTFVSHREVACAS